MRITLVTLIFTSATVANGRHLRTDVFARGDSTSAFTGGQDYGEVKKIAKRKEDEKKSKDFEDVETEGT
jgi:hypothetical protein